MPQETNMAELLRLMQTMIIKFDDLNVRFDGLATDMKEVKSGVKKLETRLGRLEGKVDIFYRQFQDIAGVVIKGTQRTDSLEERVGLLESKSH